MTGLLDVLKEADLRIGFTDEFPSVSAREVIWTVESCSNACSWASTASAPTPDSNASARATSVSPTRNCSTSGAGSSRRTPCASAIARVVNAILAARDPAIWGEGTTACASTPRSSAPGTRIS